MLMMTAIHTLNPDLRVYEYCDSQIVFPLKHLEFLPSGIIRDLGYRDSFFALLQLVATWCAAMASWKLLKIGAFRVFFIKFFAINGLLFAILGIVQDLTNAMGLYWVIPTNSLFYSSFYLRTSAGNFIFMALLCCISWAVSEFKAGNYTASFALFAGGGISIFSCVLASSEGVDGILIISFFAVSVYLLWRFIRSKLGGAPATAIVSMAILLLGVSVYVIFERQIQSRIVYELESPNSSLCPRIKINKVSVKIFESSPIFGVGAGSYGVRVEMLLQSKKSDFGFRNNSFINAAHNDLFEYLCEYGLVGGACVLLCVLLWIGRLFPIDWSVHNTIFLWGCIMSGMHSFFDLHLHIPSTMFAFVFLMSLAAGNFRTSES